MNSTFPLGFAVLSASFVAAISGCGASDKAIPVDRWLHAAPISKLPDRPSALEVSMELGSAANVESLLAAEALTLEQCRRSALAANPDIISALSASVRVDGDS